MGVPLFALLDALGPASLVVDYLENSAFDLLTCNSLGELWSAAKRTPGGVALVDWRRIGGLLGEDHQHYLAQVDQAAPLVLLVDDTFRQPGDGAELGATVVLNNPILRSDLLALLSLLSHETRTCAKQGQSRSRPWPRVPQGEAMLRSRRVSSCRRSRPGPGSRCRHQAGDA